MERLCALGVAVFTLGCESGRDAHSSLTGTPDEPLADESRDMDQPGATGSAAGEMPSGSGASPSSGAEPRDAVGPGALPVPAFDNDAPTDGATITYQNIGAPGWYPSRRDPASDQCDAVDSDSCCMTQKNYESDRLAPWDEDLIMQLRGPMLVERFAVYQPNEVEESRWDRVAIWDRTGAVPTSGVVFGADGVEGAGLGDAGFAGDVGSTCVIDAMAEAKVPCGPGSVPYCEGEDKHDGFRGSKLFVVLAKTPRMSDPEAQAMAHCGGASDNWFDAPWIGLTHGELVRSGKFGGCHCYAKNPEEWWLGDGCGQFNVFEVINDNNEFSNLDVFSTNIFGPEYIGGGPCPECSFASLGDEVELVNKSNNSAASTGDTTEPGRAPGSAIRRPTNGYRYFVVLLDVPSRTIQTGIIHPDNIPSSVTGLLPGLPEWVGAGAMMELSALRLPN